MKEIIYNIEHKICKYAKKINNRWVRMTHQPIPIFLFHQVADTFDSTTMIECDYTPTKQQQMNILALKKKYHFVALSQVHHLLQQPSIRFRHYAALTSDDGWASLKNILPWLLEHNIPITLFINPHYADGKSFRTQPTERYLTRSEIADFVQQSHGLITIGLHGLEHVDVTTMCKEQFQQYVEESIRETSSMPGYVPYWAYTWGKYNAMTEEILHKYGLTPVYINGEKNSVNHKYLNRELVGDCGFNFSK